MSTAPATPNLARVTAVLVPLALVLVAGAGYLLLMASGRALGPDDFAALTSFYLLSNTVGRGTFAVLELELTRAVPRAHARGETAAGPIRAVARGGLVLAVAMSAAILVLGGVLQHVLGGWPGVFLLVVAAATLALSSFVRGPLAGTARYGQFAGTLAVEATCYLVGAGLLLVLGATSVLLWMGLLALGPLVGALVVIPSWARGARARTAWARVVATSGVGRIGPATLVAGSSLYLFSQAVWNLGPVIANGRTSDAAVAAAFAASAVLLRAPVMAFPAVQALLLPRLAARAESGDGPYRQRRPGSRLVALLVVVGILWLAASVLVVPPVVRVFFALSASVSWPVLVMLALSVALGVIVQGTQTQLLARDRTTLVAGGWAVGTVVLLACATLAGDGVVGAAVGQLSAATVVLVVQVIGLRHLGTTT